MRLPTPLKEPLQGWLPTLTCCWDEHREGSVPLMDLLVESRNLGGTR